MSKSKIKADKDGKIHPQISSELLPDPGDKCEPDLKLIKELESFFEKQVTFIEDDFICKNCESGLCYTHTRRKGLK